MSFFNQQQNKATICTTKLEWEHLIPALPRKSGNGTSTFHAPHAMLLMMISNQDESDDVVDARSRCAPPRNVHELFIY